MKFLQVFQIYGNNHFIGYLQYIAHKWSEDVVQLFSQAHSQKIPKTYQPCQKGFYIHFDCCSFKWQAHQAGLEILSNLVGFQEYLAMI